MGQLPNKLHLLIPMAAADMQACYADPAYIVNFTFWHYPRIINSNPVCSVCLGGAVMAKTLTADITLDLSPGELSVADRQTGRRLGALERIRCGEVAEAILNFYDGNSRCPSIEFADSLEAEIFSKIRRHYLEGAVDSQERLDSIVEYFSRITEFLKKENL